MEELNGQIRNKVSIRQQIDQTPNLPGDYSLFNSDRLDPKICNISVKLFAFLANCISLKHIMHYIIDVRISPFELLNILNFSSNPYNYQIFQSIENTIGSKDFSRGLHRPKSKQKRIWSAWSSHLVTRTRMAEPSNKRNNRIIDFGRMIGRSTIIIHYYP